MVKTNKFVAVPSYKKFKMDLKIQKKKRQNNNQQNHNRNISLPFDINPFNDPPLYCNESDIRWIWRKKLEERRGHIENRRFYSTYVGSKKSRQFYIDSTARNAVYCGTHHLKHLVKIGCPQHDLCPVLTELGYVVNPSICNHKSHACPNNNNDRYLMAQVCLKDVGLIFTRNAFSQTPLSIKYEDRETELFSTEIYMKRIANTNFSKSFRPGSYGKLSSLKKGSWKEGKVFYVFENDELMLNIDSHLWLSFDLKSCASNSDNEQNTIDGWKNIVGGVGFYRAPSAMEIASVLVLRKHQNFPLECLETSSIKIYSDIPNPAGVLFIGSQIYDFNALSQQRQQPQQPQQYHHHHHHHHRQQQSQLQIQAPQRAHVQPQYIHHVNTSSDDEISRIKYEYNVLLQQNNRLQITNTQLMENNTCLDHEKQHLMSQIGQFQRYVAQQHEQITQLNEQIDERNTFFTNEVQSVSYQYPLSTDYQPQSVYDTEYNII